MKTNDTFRWLCLLVGLFCGAALGNAQWKHAPQQKNHDTKGYIYRFWLTDKRGCGYSTDQPRQFLSAKAVERRLRQHLPVDSTDLPVSREYLHLFQGKDYRVAGVSKWNNTVLIHALDTAAVAPLKQLGCVKGWAKVWQAPDSITPLTRRDRMHEEFNPWDSVKSSRYAASEEQIKVMNGHRLHQDGYWGKGLTIAVLDGGFMNADRLPAFARTKIAGTHNFVYTLPGSVYQGIDHGTKVLSAMAAWAPHVLIGTAPEAAYWLLRCEDKLSEQTVEEDYWAMAAEFADSVGADLINSSLGYTLFDDHTTDHHYHEQDGRTALISRTASMLADKGIVLVNSMGNNGMGPWKKMVFPADADDILAVGAVTPQLTNAPFSSVGNTQDGRIKPDVMAYGSPACMISGRGTLVQDMGTSFAAPLVCGMAACLWQALPHLSAHELMRLIRQSGNNSRHPDNIYGYGVPDFRKALLTGRQELQARH